MKLWQRLIKYLKGHEKWIEIRLPEYFKNKDNGAFKKDEETLDDEERVLNDLELRKEEE